MEKVKAEEKDEILSANSLKEKSAMFLSKNRIEPWSSHYLLKSDLL